MKHEQLMLEITEVSEERQRLSKARVQGLEDNIETGDSSSNVVAKLQDEMHMPEKDMLIM
jgi:hypothetical protein